MSERSPWTEAGIRWGEGIAEAEEKAEKTKRPDTGEEAIDEEEYQERLEHKGFYMSELKSIEGMKRVLAAKRGKGRK